MFKRITLATLASAAILSSAALSPASAGHPVMGGMHHPGGFFGPRMPAGGLADPEASTQLGPWPALAAWPDCPCPHSRITRTGIGIGVIGVYGPVFVDQGYVAPAYVASAPAPVATCPANCLAKQYLQDGSVLFTDQCTNENATAPAGSHG